MERSNPVQKEMIVAVVAGQFVASQNADASFITISGVLSTRVGKSTTINLQKRLSEQMLNNCGFKLY
jgi:hypothetical protein